MAATVRPLRLAVAVMVVAVVGLSLTGCVADPPPIIGTATPGNGRAVVSWQPPLAAPAPISGYVVTPWIGFTRQTPVAFTSTATTQTVTGLTNGLTYTFTVHAVNARGDESAESGMSNPVTPGPPIGQEFPVSDPVYGPNRHGQRNAQVAAFDGTNYLVVWVDQRNAPNTETWGARVAPDGTVLDVAGIRIAAGGGPPDVAFDGTNYLVVWGTGQGVAAARVSTSGAVLDPTPVQIVANGSTGAVPRVSAGNGGSLIVWEACSAEGPCSPTQSAPAIHDVLGARLASDGTVLDTTPITIASGMATAGGFDVAFDGTNHLVAFGNITLCCPPQFPVQYGIVAQQVSGTGTLLGSQFLIVSGLSVSVSPSLSFNGTNVVAIWNNQENSTSRVRGARVSPAGVVLDPSGFDVSTAEGGASVPAVAFDGTNTLVAWEDHTGSPPGTLLVRRVDSEGTPVDSAPIAVVTGQDPALAAGNGQALLAFANGYSLTASVEAVRINSGTILDHPPFLVSTQANDQIGEAMARAASGSFVVWADGRSGTTDIYGARVAGGSMLDATGIPISTATNSQTSPAVVFDGTGYFVVWTDTRSGTSDIYGTRVTADGVVLDPGGIQITNTSSVAETGPTMAFDGTNYFVVWSGSSGGISGARVSTTGTVLDPAGLVLATAGTPSNPTVAFGGGSYFVAWQTNGGVTTPDVLGARVSAAGAVLDPVPLVISNRPTSESVPQIAFNGTNFLVVWEDQRNGSSTDVFGARVTPAGAVLDPSGVAISTASDLQREPHVAANAANYGFFVVWRDDRSRGSSANASDIYGTRVSGAGVVRDPSGVAITNTNQTKFDPTVAPNAGTGAWEVAYTRFAGGAQYGSFRVFHRSVTLN